MHWPAPLPMHRQRLNRYLSVGKQPIPSALMSNLQKNEELKSVLLQETPWVLQAKNEAQQKKNIALLFDLVRMSNELKQMAISKLQEYAKFSNGGFVWFKGGPDDRYMTQYILTGIGHLKKLKVHYLRTTSRKTWWKKPSLTSMPVLKKTMRKCWSTTKAKVPIEWLFKPAAYSILVYAQLLPEYSRTGWCVQSV